MRTQRYPGVVRVWLLAGLIMVTIQILLGGITRLTGSGLSITSWEIVTGTLPPMSHRSWVEEFEKYQQTPQYEKINTDMNLAGFRFIYLWEYAHRLWARLMGFVFVIPLVIFWRRGWLDKALWYKLLWIVALAAVAASFGWIMVKSGLLDRPWVDAYKLSLHLNLGLLLLAVILWTYLSTLSGEIRILITRGLRQYIRLILVLLVGQLLLGGIMSGMKAGLFYPTWPDMNGQFLPAVLLDSGNWSWNNLRHYDSHLFASALVQFSHRIFAYTLFIVAALFVWRAFKYKFGDRLNTWSLVLLATIAVQIILGILTVINCVGHVPIWLGVLHQLGACLVIGAFVVIKFVARPE